MGVYFPGFIVFGKLKQNALFKVLEGCTQITKNQTLKKIWADKVDESVLTALS